MSEETKNLIVIVLLAGFALASFWIWRRKQTGSNGVGVTAGDVYIAGGTPTGEALAIPNPDGSGDTSSVPAASSFFNLIAQSQIG